MLGVVHPQNELCPRQIGDRAADRAPLPIGKQHDLISVLGEEDVVRPKVPVHQDSGAIELAVEGRSHGLHLA